MQVDPAANDPTCNGTCKGNQSAGRCWAFHSGRQYGTHAASETPSGYSQTSVVAGSPVGSFTDWFCNVSRYLALLRSLLGKPDSRELAWSIYTGFHSTYFTTIDAAFKDDPWPVVGRLGNWANGCIHRFSDSRVTVNDQSGSGSPAQPVLAYNYFRQLRPISDCLQEQYALYLPPSWTDAKQKAWGDCAVQNLAAPGWWEVHAREEATGKLVFNRSASYMWGWSSHLLPPREDGDAETLYFVEDLGHDAEGQQPPPARAFDLRDLNRSRVVDGSQQYTTKLSLHALSTDKNGAVVMHHRGNLPVAARPVAVMADAMISTNRTTADGTGFSELVTRPNADADADAELVDIQISEWEDPPCTSCPKIWMGWSEEKGSLIAKAKTDDGEETKGARPIRQGASNASHLKIMSAWGMNMTQMADPLWINVGGVSTGCGDEWTPSMFESLGLPGWVSAPHILCGQYAGPWPCQDRARCDPDVTGHEWPLNATEGKVCKPASGGRPASVCHACMCTGWETLLEETFTPLRPLFDNGTYLGVFL